MSISTPVKPKADATSAAETPCADSDCTIVDVGETTVDPAGAWSVTPVSAEPEDVSTALIERVPPTTSALSVMITTVPLEEVSML